MRVRNARPILVSAINGRSFRSRRIPISPIRMLRLEVSMRGTMGGITLDKNISMDSWTEGGRREELGR